MRCVHALCLVALVGAAQPAPEHHKYVIVGAGPGGLQIGHFLQSAGRDYVILDKHDAAGSFFLRYPRWRQLISINKPNTGRSDSFDFNSRHDWNSLLGEPSHSGAGQARTTVPCPGTLPQDGVDCHASSFSSSAPERTMATVDERTLFAHYAGGVYYPNADALASFLQAWSNGSLPSVGPALNIRMHTAVVKVDRPEGYVPKPAPSAPAAPDAWPRLEEIARDEPRFVIRTRTGKGAASKKAVLTCTYLIWAGGLQEPVQPHGVNTVEAIAKGWVRTYTTASTRVEDYFNKSVLLLGRGNAAFEFANHVLGTAAFVHLVGQRRKRISQAIETHYPGDVRHIHSNLLETYLLKSMDGMAEVTMQYLQYEPEGGGSNRTWVRDGAVPCKVDEYGRIISRCLFRRPYDHVIVCPGWRMARGTSLFSESTQPALFVNGKHPSVTARYESTNVPGLFFAGNLAHAPDFKKSSGGFIHGFRYTARALHRELEEEEQAAAAAVAARRAAMAAAEEGSAGKKPKVVVEGTGWPRVAHIGIRAVTEALLRRMNTAAGPYQMFGSLGDVLVLPPFTAEEAKGFSGSPGLLAPFTDPWSFPPPGAVLAAATATGNATFSAVPPRGSVLGWVPRPPTEQPLSSKQRRNEAVLDSAMSGLLFEELPVRLAEYKAGGWAAQLSSARHPSLPAIPASLAAGMGLGGLPVLAREYIVMTLEFGTGAGPLPEGAAEARRTDDPMDEVRRRTDLQRDPFSLLRANVGLHNPEASHFLHPVLRYFHTGLTPAEVKGEWSLGVSSPTPLYPGGPPPLAECHLVEDFWAEWTVHSAHALQVARFLQDVAARRAAMALALGDVPAGSIATSGGIARAAIGADPDAVVHSALALRSVWAVKRPRTAYSTSVVEDGERDGARIFIRGRAVRGGNGWYHRLSIMGADETIAMGPRLHVLIFVDFHPIPPSLAEATWTRDVLEEATSMATLGVFERRLAYAQTAPFAVPTPALNREQASAMAAEEAAFVAKWRKLTAGLLHDLVVIALPCRAGPGRVWRDSVVGKNDINPESACGGAASKVVLVLDGVRSGVLQSPYNEEEALLAQLKVQLKAEQVKMLEPEYVIQPDGDVAPEGEFDGNGMPRLDARS